MNVDNQLKLQSFLDGELPPHEIRTVAGVIQRDPTAAALVAELKMTRQTLRHAESPVAIAESREFYWSKIQQQIEKSAVPSPPRRAPGLWAQLRFLVLPAAATAVLIILGLALCYHARKAPSEKPAPGNASPDTALAATATNHTVTR